MLGMNVGNTVSTLFDVLTGNNKNVFDETALHKSIQNHLMLLLNTRQGSLQHLPNYGIPDLQHIYQGLPNSLNSFSHRLSKIIEQYEPRLTQVIIQNRPVQQNNCIIYFEIRAQIKLGGQIFFDTYFMSGGNALIESAEIYE